MITFPLQCRQARPRRLPPPEAASGFTLVELLIVVTIIAILAAITAPSFEGMARKMALNGAASELAAGLQFARSEALRQGRPLIFKLDTERNWKVFRKPEGNAGTSYEPPDDTLLRDNTYSNRIDALAGDIIVRYRPNGTADLADLPEASKKDLCFNNSACICLNITVTDDNFESRLVRVNSLGRPTVLGVTSKDQLGAAAVQEICK
ncbi:hypothetical protein AGMMS49960_17470 [Betaproteobacteria bacterium]|nr:hypothetical protein AGMMS49543_08090 [Betaproteobacteria bacterium]GHU03316.1 hypothetical protein AGMMS49960_17470 [Betaproteobacteria bacterium]GHU06787.1 hypothetical protein AGMMS50225_02680 [Betaproteobacteria bacterium]GHU18148.1 hypothetical protein AGMMS50243_07630 [Betaproteobacteria bacterium]